MRRLLATITLGFVSLGGLTACDGDAWSDLFDAVKCWGEQRDQYPEETQSCWYSSSGSGGSFAPREPVGPWYPLPGGGGAAGAH